jgi:hypothetical protein
VISQIVTRKMALKIASVLVSQREKNSSKTQRFSKSDNEIDLGKDYAFSRLNAGCL